MPLSRSRSRSPGRWRKLSRSRSRSRRRSRTPKKSRSPSKSHKSTRKHKSKSPRPRIPSPSPHRSRARSPSSITARNLRVQAKISETSLFAELVKDRNMRELAYKKLQAAKEKAVNQDEVQIIEGTDEKDGSNASSIENKAFVDNKDKSVNHNKEQQQAKFAGESGAIKCVDVVDIPVPMSDEGGTAGKTPPLPSNQSAVGAPPLPNPSSAANVASHTIAHTSPNTTSMISNSCAINVSHSPNFPTHAGVQQPPPPPPPPPLPQQSESTVLSQVSVPIAAPVLPNMSIPPPPIPIPVPAPNIMSKFNPPNNLVQLKSVDPPKPPIVAFKTKSLSKLPLPPGINQNDLESIDSPPSRSPSPPSKAQLKFPASTPKPPQKKSIKDLPMPPGLFYSSVFCALVFNIYICIYTHTQNIILVH